MNQHDSPAAGGAPDFIHQGIDLAWVAAQLIASLLEGREARHRVFYGGVEGSELFMYLASDQVQIMNASPTTDRVGVITSTAASLGMGGYSDQRERLQLEAATLVVPGGETAVVYSAFPQFASGQLTACMVDLNQTSATVAALNGRNLVETNSVPLLAGPGNGEVPLLAFDLDGTGITVYNNSPESVRADFVLTTGTPAQNFTVGTEVPGGQSTRRLAFPCDISGQIVATLSAQAVGSPKILAPLLDAARVVA